MERTTRFRFNEFTQQIGTLNGVSQAEVTTSYFTVEPSIQQKLVTRMQESTAFLGKINILPVTQMKGQVLGLTVGSSIGRNVDTSGGTRRTGIDPTGMNAFQYNCNKNNFDTALKYAKLDSWALFPDFEVRIRNVIVIRQGLDRICVGFNGTSYALTSNITANPLLQDFNRGWLQAIREDAPQRVLDEVADGKVAGKVTYGAYGDYENLDALVWDAKEELLPIWAREDPDLVVIVGSKLLHDKYFPLINRSEGSLDMMARQVIMTDKQLGGLPVFRVPYFPTTPSSSPSSATCRSTIRRAASAGGFRMNRGWIRSPIISRPTTPMWSRITTMWRWWKTSLRRTPRPTPALEPIPEPPAPAANL
jgi:P2 family phage major capsid protein